MGVDMVRVSVPHVQQHSIIVITEARQKPIFKMHPYRSYEPINIKIVFSSYCTLF